MIKEAAFQNIV